MKKFILVSILLLTFGLSIKAEGDNASEVSKVEAYDININMNSLVRYLDLSKDQIDAVESVHQIFTDGLRYASKLDDESRLVYVHSAMIYDLQNMRYILNEKQYKKYLTCLQMTFNNRGIKWDISQLKR